MESAAFVKAAEVGNLHQVNAYLLKHAGNVPDFRPPFDFRVEAVHKAAENRHVSVVETIVRQCPNVLSHDVDQLGRTLLHIAARTGQEDVVKLFSPKDRERMQVNAKAKGDITTLHLAAYCGHEAVVKLICGWKGIHLAATSAEELNALHMASQQGHGKVVRVLIDACRKRSPDSLTAFVNAQDCLGRTPLHYASAGGHVDVVKELLGLMEVDPSVPDKVMGLVPLHLAAWMGDHAEVVKMLTGVPAIDHNAQVAPDENAAIISAMSQLQTMTRCPNYLAREAIHETSFTWKEENTWDQVYEIVLSIGGGTALHLACQQNHKAVWKLSYSTPKLRRIRWITMA